MYPRLNTWIRNPTKATTKRSKRAGASRKNPNFKPQDKKQSFEKKPFTKPFAPKVTPPSDEKQKNAKEWAKKKIQEELHKGKKKTEKIQIELHQ